VIHVFQTMVGVRLHRGRPFIKRGFQPRHDISGIIGLSGKARGTIVLCLEREMALITTAALLAEQPNTTQITADVIDAVGELTNMIAGNAKAKLEQFAMSVSLPSVITGKGHCIEFPSGTKPICIPFTCDAGNLDVEVGLIEIPQTAPTSA
ncbi:MAG: chemotaxis protein CheX, partial [Thermoguttaceae bacterium]